MNSTRTLTLLLGGTLAGAIQAQTATQFDRHSPKDAPDQQMHATQLTTPAVRGGGSAIWSEDFGNGFPAGWTVQDMSGICPWVWSLDGSYGYYNGSQGASAGTAIASTTAANGFLIVDPDSANNVNYGQPSGTTYQYLDSYFTTSAIDLTGHPYVNLEFEQFFRFNNTPDLEVKVSTDQITWTTYTVQGDVQPNQTSPNVDHVSLNISSVAGDQATVYIQIGWSARVYYWMIDDMRIVDAPANDLRLTNAWYDEWFFDQADDFGTLEYATYPATQVRPMHFKGMVSNQGFQDQMNVTLQADVRDAANNSVYTGTDMTSVLSPLDVDSLYPTEWTPPGTTESYKVVFTLSSDSTDATPDDNMLTKRFNVAPYIFARDRDSLTGRYDNGGDAYELGNWFNIVNNGDMLYGVDVAVDDDTPTGVIFSALVKDGNRDLIDVTDEHEVVAADLNAGGDHTFVTLPFPSPIPLDAASDYLVMVQHFGGSDNLWTGISGTSVPQTSLIYDTPTDTYFYLTSTPMVRMNLDPSIGLHELGDAGERIGGPFPNPAADQTSFTCLLDHAVQRTDLEIMDASGRLVRARHIGRLAPGSHRFDISVQDLEAGVYLCAITLDGQRTTHQLVVRK